MRIAIIIMLSFTLLPLAAQKMELLFGNSSLKRNCMVIPENQMNRSSIESSANLLKPNDSSTYIIPVVFHIIHANGYENVRRLDVLRALEILNERFNLENPDTINIPAPFRQITGNSKIKFRLATKDPFGNCTTGINRYEDRFISALGNIDFLSTRMWDDEKYLNISVSCRLALDGQLAGALALLPGSSDRRDGVYISAIKLLHDDIILTHEIGHWFNLRHLWAPVNEVAPEDGCILDDFVDDTPNQAGANLGCPVFPSISCMNGPNGDNFHNYMDYTECGSMFTKGQVERMHDALNNQAVGFRYNLWQPENLVATGTSDSIPLAICPNPPEAEFMFDGFGERNLPCNPIQFYDLSWKSTPTAWEWTFEGGEPRTSTEQNPFTQFPNSGTYNVQLIASNEFGSTEVTRTVEVFVFPENDYYGDNLVESFEFSEMNKELFQRSDAKVDISEWKITDRASFNGKKSVHRTAPASDNYPKDYDQLILPPMNIDGLEDIKLSFATALAKPEGTLDGQFVVLMNSNCSYDDQLQVLMQETNLENLITTKEVIDRFRFFPNDDQWMRHEIDIPRDWIPSNEVFLQFTIQCDECSHFFLDDIRMESSTIATSIDNEPSNAAIQVMPNPLEDMLLIKSQVNDHRIKNVELINANGQVMIKKAFRDDKVVCEIGMRPLPGGLYIALIETTKGVFTKKIIKK